MGTDYLRSLLTSLSDETTQPYAGVPDLSSILTNTAQVQFGTYTGTGSLITVDTYGDPRCVVLYDLTQTNAALNFTGMADDSFVTLATGAQVASDGITLGTGQFTIGTNATINTASDAGYWMAII